MKMKFLVLFTAIGIMAAAAGCSSTTTANGSTTGTIGNTSAGIVLADTTAASNNVVLIESFAFNPDVLTIIVGDTVEWKNNDSVAQNIVFDAFKSDSIKNGESYKHQFDTAGTYKCICGIHPSMKGTIEVK